MPPESAPPPPIRLEAWAASRHQDDPYKAPEQCLLVLTGVAHDHPKYPGVQPITTSPVVAAAGRLVTTASGHVYELGDPGPDYLAWLDAHHPGSWDPACPVRVAAPRG